MKRFLRVVLIGVFAILIAGLTACADNNGGGAAGGGHSQGVTDSVVRVGNTAAVSGPFAAVGVPFNDGILAYFEKVNNAGGVHGRRIEFVHHDDNFDAVTGLAFTEALIHDDNVFAIVGHFGTPTVGATMGLLRETGIPVVYFASGIGALYNEEAFTIAQGQNLFPVQPIFTTEGRVLVARAIEEYSAQNIGVIFTSDEAGLDFINGINNQANRMQGITIVSEQVAPMQADVSSAVLRMVAEDVDVVIVATLQATLPIIINSMVAQGLNVPVFTSYISADAMTIGGFAADYMGGGATFPIYATAWLDIGTVDDGFTPEFYDFVDGVTAFGQPALAENAFAMAGWIAGSVFVQGLRNTPSDSITWDAYIHAMETTIIDLPMGGIMNFANGQRTGTQAMALVRANVAELVWETIRPIETLDAVIQRVE